VVSQSCWRPSGAPAIRPQHYVLSVEPPRTASLSCNKLPLRFEHAARSPRWTTQRRITRVTPSNISPRCRSPRSGPRSHGDHLTNYPTIRAPRRRARSTHCFGGWRTHASADGTPPRSCLVSRPTSSSAVVQRCGLRGVTLLDHRIERITVVRRHLRR
jgi:hypothetical protein